MQDLFWKCLRKPRAFRNVRSSTTPPRLVRWTATAIPAQLLPLFLLHSDRRGSSELDLVDAHEIVLPDPRTEARAVVAKRDQVRQLRGAKRPQRGDHEDSPTSARASGHA